MLKDKRKSVKELNAELELPAECVKKLEEKMPVRLQTKSKKN